MNPDNTKSFTTFHNQTQFLLEELRFHKARAMDGGDLQIESLLQVIDPPLAADDDRQVHVALQRLVVGDDDAMELRETSVLHDHTDNDSEESASTSTRATANQRIASTSDPKKRKRRFTYIVRKVPLHRFALSVRGHLCFELTACLCICLFIGGEE